MYCDQHPDVPATQRCVGCSENKCFNCLVEIRGEAYCGECKVLALDGKTPVLETSYECNEAKECLKYAFGTILTLFCGGIFAIAGFIAGVMAIQRGIAAKRRIALDPALSGTTEANAGIALAVVIMLFAGVVWAFQLFMIPQG